jgi:hypothetical protein
MSLRSLLNGTSLTLSSLSFFIENRALLVNDLYFFKNLGTDLVILISNKLKMVNPKTGKLSAIFIVEFA